MASSPTQEAHSLSTFHWLFSEEMPDESLPQFFPRVLDFEQSSTQPSHGAPFRPGPRYRRDQSYQEYSSPIYDPDCSPCYYPDSPQWAPGPISQSISSPQWVPGPTSQSISSPQWAPGPSSGSISRPTLQLSQAPELPFECQGRKRHTESPQEADQRPRKYARPSDSRSDSHVDSEKPDGSAAGTPPTTATHSLHSSESPSSSSLACFDHIKEIQRLRAQLVISESRNARAMADLAEARLCVDFLMNEVGRVMASTSQAHPAAERVRQIIRSNTELRVPLFTRASPEMTTLADSQQDTLPVVDNADAAWSEDLDPRNPNSYYFSELPMAGPSRRTGTIPLAASSQLAPIGGFQGYGSMTSVGGEGSTSYSEMVREASLDYRSTSSLTEAGRSHHPSGSQLVPDWSHTRVDSYYFSEPLPPFDSAQETTRESYAPNYELPATRYS
ncbi:hypothetical protein PGT21_005211 [Puccinia graminis f. sp. tritici]|uniref:Uncharacterized protein n=1 Tax=Puccinia graminis f. sp. tritici TaxID=56615 RepID=A0A5B0QZQ1_PUCGR|nr:hypothetical protein PGT21_005211 [Puccinia graminis f. sp. tritici]